MKLLEFLQFAIPGFSVGLWIGWNFIYDIPPNSDLMLSLFLAEVIVVVGKEIVKAITGED